MPQLDYIIFFCGMFIPEHTDGINIYIVPVDDLSTFDTKDLGRCLVVSINDNFEPKNAAYHDMFGMNAIDISAINMNAIFDAASFKGVKLSFNRPYLIHINPEEISEILTHEQAGIRTADDMVQLYFSAHPTHYKLSRKDSGLAHSYLTEGPEETTQLDNKEECRLVWLDSPAEKQVFMNLPENTSAAYCVVKSKHSAKHTLYYIEKDSPKPAIKVADFKKPTFFNPFKLNNRGLSKEELDSIDRHYEHMHVADHRHILGKGGFGLVKKSSSPSAEGVVNKKATKIQAIRFGQSKVHAELQTREAYIANDLDAASGHLGKTAHKTYLNMYNLGQPITEVVPSCSLEERVDLSIKFLIEVSRLHSGEASKTKTPYAHRDIKLDNVLINTKTGAIRLIDFGLTTPEVTNKSELSRGTLFYAALDQELINHFLRVNHHIKEDTDENSDIDTVMDSSWGAFEDEEDTSEERFGISRKCLIIWCARRDSNPRHLGSKPSTLSS